MVDLPERIWVGGRKYVRGDATEEAQSFLAESRAHWEQIAHDKNDEAKANLKLVEDLCVHVGTDALSRELLLRVRAAAE